MLKRLALVAAAVGGIVFIRSKVRQQQAEQDLWNQATDDVQAESPATPAPRGSSSRASARPSSSARECWPGRLPRPRPLLRLRPLTRTRRRQRPDNPQRALVPHTGPWRNW